MWPCARLGVALTWRSRNTYMRERARMYVMDLVRVHYLRTLTRHHTNTDRTQPGPIFAPELNTVILMIDDDGAAV